MVDLKEIIKGFCEKCKLELYDNYEINVTDISEYVKSDDIEYYFERKEFIDQAMGDIVNIGLHFILKNVRPYAASCSEA